MELADGAVAGAAQLAIDLCAYSRRISETVSDSAAIIPRRATPGSYRRVRFRVALAEKAWLWASTNPGTVRYAARRDVEHIRISFPADGVPSLCAAGAAAELTIARLALIPVYVVLTLCDNGLPGPPRSSSVSPV